MINNNLDYEKSTSTSSSATTTPEKAAPEVASSVAAAATKTSNDNHQSSNNSYFNRFDNRIAANLAAVINGARFRSSSTGSNKTASSAARTATSKLSHYGASQRRNVAAVTAATAATATATGIADKNADVAGSKPNSPMLSSATGRRRPMQLFTQSANLNCNDNEKVLQTPPSSDEDNSPTELNNCKRLADKPPLVKRLAMGLLRNHEESRPLVQNTTPTSNTNTNHTTTSTATATLKGQRSTMPSEAIYSNGYINAEAFEPEKYIASKFGDSCRQSLTAIPMLDTVNLNDNSEFQLKKRYLRETSSANSSPKIFANRLRTATLSSAVGGSTHNVADYDADDEDLKDAPWFQAGISRDIALEVLASKSPGAFLVRRSTSKPGCYALTLRVPAPPGPKVANYIILRTARGYKIKGFRKEFSSLKTLITHHSVMPELLPVPLAMPRPKNMTSSRRNLDDFDTYDSLQMLLNYLRAKNLENE